MSDREEHGGSGDEAAPRRESGGSNRRWSPEEHERLLELVAREGHQWRLLASSFPGRAPGQLKNAYYSFVRRVARKEAGKQSRKKREEDGIDVVSVACKPKLPVVRMPEQLRCLLGCIVDIIHFAGSLAMAATGTSDGVIALSPGPFGFPCRSATSALG